MELPGTAVAGLVGERSGGDPPPIPPGEQAFDVGHDRLAFDSPEVKAIIERVQTRFETYDAAGTSDLYWCVDHVSYEPGVPGVTTVSVSICRRLVGRDDSRRFPVCWYETMRVRLIQYGTEWLKPVLVSQDLRGIPGWG